jgi:pyrroline-5-carboxylate reductase
MSAARRWGFIGSGKMATALIQGLLRAEDSSSEMILASDPVANARFALASETGVRVTESNLAVIEESQVVILAVKPQSMGGVLAEIREAVSTDHLIISIAAGIPLAALENGLGLDRRLARVMPNTPALVSEGASCYCLGSGAKPGDEDIVRSLLDAVGRSFRVPESQLDAVTGLSGSGPAFVYIMIEALSDGGVRVGLPRELATALAAQTVLGAARMVLETGQHPGLLKDNVTSPGGTTIAGVHALERGAVRAALIDAVEAATRRSTELASQVQPRRG